MSICKNPREIYSWNEDNSNYAYFSLLKVSKIVVKPSVFTDASIRNPNARILLSMHACLYFSLK